MSFNKILDIVFIFFISLIIVTFAWQFNFKALNDISEKYSIGVVFGAGITKSGDPSPALKYRLEKGIELYRENKLEKILISGRIPETIVMKNYLLIKGINIENIIIDINGNNTSSTLKNIKKLQQREGEKLSFAFISQKYHLARIFLLAHKYGIKNFCVVSTDTRNIDKIENLLVNIRETFAIFKSLIFE